MSVTIGLSIVSRRTVIYETDLQGVPYESSLNLSGFVIPCHT